LNLKTDWGRNAYESLLAGDVDAASIGYNEIKGKNAVNADDGVKDLNELDLWEISTVSFPSNEAATVDEVKSIEVEGSKAVNASEWAKLKAEVDSKSVADLSAYHRRLHEWAAQGNILNGFTRADMNRFHAMIEAALQKKGGGDSQAASPLQWGGKSDEPDEMKCSFDTVGEISDRADEEAKGGKDTEPDEIKAGRVLSSANANDLTTAHGHIAEAHNLIGGVLQKLQPADEAAAQQPTPKKPAKADNELLIKQLSKLNDQLKGII
jgi:hypothetical protein